MAKDIFEVPADQITSVLPIMREIFKSTPVIGKFDAAAWTVAWQSVVLNQNGIVAVWKPDEIAGIILCYLANDVNTGEVRALINNFYVSPKYSGVHAGEALLNHAEAWARRAGARRLFFDYLEGNVKRPNQWESLTSVFSGLGFKPDSRVFVKEL